MAGQFFDPLNEWFGIPPAEQPPDFYRLLGILRYEAEKSVIDAGFSRRVDALKRHWRGPYRSEAKRLYKKVLAAQLCLTTSAMKANYDAALRGQEVEYERAQRAQAAREAQRTQAVQQAQQAQAALAAQNAQQYQIQQTLAPPAAAAIYAEAPQPAPPTPTVVVSEPPPYRQRRRKLPQNNVISLAMTFVGPICGLALGYFILCAIDRRYDFLNVFPPKESIAQKDELSPEPRRQTMPQRHVVPKELPPTPEPEEPALIWRPVPMPRPAFTVPQFVNLPERGVEEPVEFAHVIGDVSLALHAPKGNPVEFALSEPDDSGGHRTWTISAVNGDEMISVATIEHRNDRLNFRWSEGADIADQSAECLRNCVLSINVGGEEKSVVLRTVTTAATVLIDLDDTATVVPIECPLWGLDPKSLILEVTLSDGPIPDQIVPADRRNPLGQAVRLLFREKPPTAEVSALLTASKAKVSLKLSPIMADWGGNKLPWTTKRVNSMQQTLTKNIANAQQDLNAMGYRLKAIADRVRQIENTVVPVGPRATALMIEKNGLISEGQQLERKAGTAQKNLAEWSERIRLLPPLMETGNLVHRKTKLHYRVFCLAGGSEVELVKSD